MKKAAKQIEHYRHPPAVRSTQEPDTAPGPYYVSAIDGPRTAYVSGPYETHREALDLVEQARILCERHDSRALWAAFGTVRCKCGTTHPGKLQEWGYNRALTERNGAPV